MRHAADGMSERVYIGLGSNLDDPGRQIERALASLCAIAGSEVVAVSACYRTRPWGNPDQPDFVNAVAGLDVRIAPLDLLHATGAIERRMGRLRDGTRWAPRTIDLDLLFFGRRTFAAPGLNLPHPHALQRAFVLAPLVEVAAFLADPRLDAWRRQLDALPHGDVIRLQAPTESAPARPPDANAH
jgi:2-amino-4-hydroxy-6-hydroxymethyldihydropteridine diphosphokinase